MPYEFYLPALAPPWLRREVGADFWASVGEVFDSVRDRAVDATKARFPRHAAGDALDQIGRDRKLPRMTGEGDAAYAARLVNAWTTWGEAAGVGGGAGSHLAMLKAIELLGLPVGATGATIIQANGRFSQLVAGVLTLGTCMNCIHRANLQGALVPAPGWFFEPRDTFYSTFGVLFPANVVALTAGSLLAAQLNDTVEKWRPAKAVFMGTWIIESGRLLGWPTTGGRTLGTEPNLGGNVRRYIAPAAGAPLGYAA